MDKPTIILIACVVALVAFAAGTYPIVSRMPKEPAAQHTIQLYYYNPTNDIDAAGTVLCSEQGLVSVPRSIFVKDTVLEDSIRLLLKGEMLDGEKTDGITTEFPLEGLTLQSASIENGEVVLVFDDPLQKTSGGACRVTVLRHQIEATAKQFPEITSVRILPETVFQP